MNFENYQIRTIWMSLNIEWEKSKDFIVDTLCTKFMKYPKLLTFEFQCFLYINFVPARSVSKGLYSIGRPLNNSHYSYFLCTLVF